MSVNVAHLQQLVATIAGGLTAAANPSQPNNLGVNGLRDAVAAMEVLFAALRDGGLLGERGAMSTMEKLELQYGRELGRIIAALGGLPILSSARGATLARLLVDDADARATLAHLDPEKDAELLETLYELFVPTRVKPRPAPTSLGKPSEVASKPSGAAVLYAASVATERAAYVLGANPLRTPVAEEPAAPDPDLAPEHHVADVERVEPANKSRKR